MRDCETHYGPLSKLLHWSSALLVLGLFGLGIWMVELDYYHGWYHTGPALHISFGLLLLALTVLRLSWRSLNRSPVPLASHSRIITSAATVVKCTLYLLLLIILFSGYAITTAEGQPARFFDSLTIPALMAFEGDQVDWLGRIHLWGAGALIALVAGHAGAALFHHLVHKDATLKRMLPFGRVNSTDTTLGQ